MTTDPALEALKEYDRLSLVISSAVNHADPGHNEAVGAMIRQGRSAIAAAEASQEGDQEKTVSQLREELRTTRIALAKAGQFDPRLNRANTAIKIAREFMLNLPIGTKGVSAAMIAMGEALSAQEGSGGAPIPMRLYCPACGLQHIDVPNGDWTNSPHRSHLCAECANISRSADVGTTGVLSIETIGLKDDAVPLRATPSYALLSEQRRRDVEMLVGVLKPLLYTCAWQCRRMDEWGKAHEELDLGMQHARFAISLIEHQPCPECGAPYGQRHPSGCANNQAFIFTTRERQEPPPSTEGVGDVELLPCPFCGSDEIDRDGWASESEVGPACGHCGASAVNYEYWNTRTALPRPGGLDREQVARIIRGTADEYIRLGAGEPCIQHAVSAILALPNAGGAGDWRGIESAPRNGHVIEAVGRFQDASAGYPRFVSWLNEAWRSIEGRRAGEPLVCWAWRPRAEEWPREPLPAPPRDEGA